VRDRNATPSWAVSLLLGQFHRLLGMPRVYRAFQKCLSDGGATYVRTVIRPSRGDRVLDVGCGPADILEVLPDVHYTGIDLSPQYIDHARSRFGSRGTFVCQSVAIAAVDSPGSYDIVMANGLLHHLDDADALRVFEMARCALKPTGRFVTLDGCWVGGQSLFARLLLAMDRGKFIRSEEAYLTIASRIFPRIEARIHHQLLRVPYTHITLECRP
jgi:SAM-dependent methyltransferase